jgi:dTMP kinase
MITLPGFQRRRKIGKQIEDLVRHKEQSRGLLIAFEGPDGSGKTTQRKLFKQWLKSEGRDVVTTKWNSSLLIKPLVKARKTARSLSPEEFSLLHAADFRYRLETEILPALWRGQTVIADRYLFTALARDAARGLELDWLLNVYWPVFWPDMVFYFSVSPETSSTRIAADRDPSYYEAGQDVTEIDNPLQSYRAFIARVISEYEALARIFKFVTVDAEQSVYEQHRLIRGLYEQGGRRSWEAGNREALLDWLVQNPVLAAS